MLQLAGSYTVTTDPASEPISLAEAKAHLRVDIADDDDLITRLIQAAREYAETFLQKKLITQTITWKIDEFPGGVPLEIPTSPLIAITSIKYIDTDGAEQTWASSLYRVDSVSEPGRVAPAFGEVYPVTRAVINAVEVIFTTGYGTAGTDVPFPILQAIYLLIGEMYERREDAIAGATLTDARLTAKRLLGPYRNIQI